MSHDDVVLYVCPEGGIGCGYSAGPFRCDGDHHPPVDAVEKTFRLTTAFGEPRAGTRMSAELLTPNFLLLFGDDTDKRLTPRLTGGERRREGEGQWTVVGLYFDEDEAFEAFSGWQRPMGYGPGQLVIAQVEGLARTDQHRQRVAALSEKDR